jgi:hypothetical protein
MAAMLYDYYHLLHIIFFFSSSSRSKVTPSLPLAISNLVNVDERSFFFFLAHDSRDEKKITSCSEIDSVPGVSLPATRGTKKNNSCSEIDSIPGVSLPATHDENNSCSEKSIRFPGDQAELLFIGCLG